jgi:hypothetical protein
MPKGILKAKWDLLTIYSLILNLNSELAIISILLSLVIVL